MYFLGVDNGLTRTRSVVLNLESASLVALSEVSHDVVDGLPAGQLEQDPAQWIRAVDRTVRHCLEQLGETRHRVAGIGICGQPRGMVLLDGDHRLVRPAKLAADRSATPESEEISRAFGGPPGMIELTGNSMSPAEVAAKLLWVKRHEPDHFREVKTLLMPHDFVNYWLTGVKRTEFSEASQTGLLDVRRRCWSPELVNFIDPALSEMLVPVKSSCEPHGQLRRELATGWGLSEDILVSAGGSNEMMGALGAGSVSPGTGAVSLAGAAGLQVVCERPRIDPRGDLAACCDLTDRWMLMTKGVQASPVLGEVQRYHGWNAAQMLEALSSAPAGAGGLTFLPENKRTGRKGMLAGIDGGNLTPANMARAAIEAVALELGTGLARMRELGAEVAELRLGGMSGAGGATRQILADVLGVPIFSARAEACAALGAALQAAVTFFHLSGEDLTYSEITSYAVEPDEATRCEPGREGHAFYQELLGRRRAFGELLQDEGFC